ncbi:hypothetical protein L596_011793 [Steinernema carpocapsae]|uniref:RecQ mediated genome instability protein 1 OB-fold domain-containing protein n=1 Tax=Steinernema carpocapsae TaxID=34508 RepID=A0A4U5NVS8_STECR|nr:hypothetical protein L596_011793 [Steinernema carpocapsae]
METPLADLARQGWFMDQKVMEEFLEDCEEEGYADLKAILLDTDIKEYGDAFIINKVNRRAGILEAGKYVVQMTRQRNVSYPKSSETSHPNGLFKYTFTDGHSTMSAIRFQAIPGLTEKTMPGSKLLLTGPIQMEAGMLLIDSKNCKIIGGKVDRLVEKWKIEQNEYMRAAGVKTNAPKWRPFINKPGRASQKENGKAKKEEKTIKALDVITKATTQDRDADAQAAEDEFASQRKALIDGIEKNSNKKRFAGNRNLDRSWSASSRSSSKSSTTNRQTSSSRMQNIRGSSSQRGQGSLQRGRGSQHNVPPPQRQGPPSFRILPVLNAAILLHAAEVLHSVTDLLRIANKVLRLNAAVAEEAALAVEVTAEGTEAATKVSRNLPRTNMFKVVRVAFRSPTACRACRTRTPSRTTDRVNSSKVLRLIKLRSALLELNSRQLGNILVREVATEQKRGDEDAPELLDDLGASTQEPRDGKSGGRKRGGRNQKPSERAIDGDPQNVERIAKKMSEVKLSGEKMDAQEVVSRIGPDVANPAGNLNEVNSRNGHRVFVNSERREVRIRGPPQPHVPPAARNAQGSSQGSRNTLPAPQQEQQRHGGRQGPKQHESGGAGGPQGSKKNGGRPGSEKKGPRSRLVTEGEACKPEDLRRGSKLKAPWHDDKVRN